ncbi:MAG: hypothetical protein JWP93_1674 [Polaromonas sp.]|nr:hypothetical protein [Polaromonas sp.]
MKLRGHAIVPSELYVKRRADDQLVQIIDDMGRPGYVLVARQMGKTNLLLNARRSALPDDLFVYLDVSNVIPDDRGFFRNVIDVALETAQEQSVFLTQSIANERKESQLLPHKEHERELRRLLQAIPGKLVICLDEIDALAKTKYSDSVFSFIRSIYFSGRANFAEFSRLTYVLSGVAEPGDLIKNKAISPFNIGEKIYLEDFTLDEVWEFLKLAEIELSPSVVIAIYSWTSGHPRMTWDLITELQQNSIITTDSVETAVKHLYFASVDVPPVDHIKSLVEGSREVRDALVAIHYSKSEVIADAVRTKLYLAGISSFDPDTRKVTFKNRILELALSEQFLINLDKSQPSYESAVRNIQAGLYEDGLSALRGFIKVTPEDSRIPLARYWAGVSSYFLGRYPEAISYLSHLDDFTLPVTTVVARKFFIGMSNLKLGQPREAIPLLKQAVAAKAISDFPSAHIQARVALADAVIRIGARPGEAYFDEAMQLCQSVIDQADIVKETIKDDVAFAGLQVDAHVVLAKAAATLKTGENASALLDRARIHADAAALLRLRMLEHSFAPSQTEANIVLQKAIHEVFSIKVFDKENTVEADESTLNQVTLLLRKLHKASRDDQLPKIIEHVLNHLTENVDVGVFINDLVVELFNTGGHVVARRIIEQALKTQASRGRSGHRSLLAVAIIIQETEADKYGAEFFDYYKNESSVELDDLRFITAVTLAAISHGDGELSTKGRELLGKIRIEESTIPDEDERLENESIRHLLAYCDSIHLLKFEPGPLAVSRAGELLRKLVKSRRFSIRYFPSTYHSIMINMLASRIRGLSPVAPLRRVSKKIGRNDIVSVNYGDEVRTGKYKHFQSDINNGICAIVID